MSKRVPAILLIVLALALLAGIAELLRMRFSRGDVYPVYSTYRADPLGTRALYESLELMPDVRAQRWLRDPEKLPPKLRGTLILAGMDADEWRRMEKNAAAKLDALARGGARVVVTFTAGFEERELKRWRVERDADDSTKYDVFAIPDAAAHAVKKRKIEKYDDVEKEETPNPKTPGKKKRKFVDAGAQWGVAVSARRISPDKNGNLPAALRAENQPRAWPEKLDWLSELYFETSDRSGGFPTAGSDEHPPANGTLPEAQSPAKTAQTQAQADESPHGSEPAAAFHAVPGGKKTAAPPAPAEWRTLYTRDGRAVMIERALGAGSVVLASDTFFLSNEALQRARATPLIAWLVAPPDGGRAVIFDEYHLGLEEQQGVAALARRYGLTGAACVAALLAVLWIWRRMALFVPPPPDEDESETGYEPAAGLEALLRRSVPRAQVARLCVDEWKKTASAPDVARVDKALAGLEKNASPEKIDRAVRDALRKR